MVTRAQKVRLGVFVIVSAVLLGLMLFYFVASRLGEQRDYYYTSFEETVSGLENGAPVKYQGVRVGSVEEITIDPDNIEQVRVTLGLKRGTPVKQDTVVVLNSMGITGLRFLELTEGTNQSPLLEPGSRITAGSSFIDRLTGKADIISEKIELLTNNLVVLTGPQQQEDIKAALASARRSLESIEKVAAEKQPQLSQLVDDLSVAAGDLRRLSGGLDQRLDRLQASLDSVSAELSQLGGQASLFLESQGENLDRLLADARGAMAAVREIVESDSMRAVPVRLSRMLDSTQKLVASTEGRLDRVLGGAQETTRMLNRLLADQRLEGTLDTLVKLGISLDELVKGLDLTMRQSREDLLRTLGNLKGVVRNLNDFTVMLLENPSILLWGSQLKERDL